jgi:glycosyltransferase involved in cell wall biosynthesis
MKIACIATSRVPSTTANSIQVMKVCQALVQEGHAVRLWVPGEDNARWESLAQTYGLQTEFEIQWVQSNPALKRYDFIWRSYRQARSWGAELVYAWLPQPALLALREGLPAMIEVHDRPTGSVGPLWYRLFFRQKGRKRALLVSEALQRALERQFGIHFNDAEVCIMPNGADLERYLNLPSLAEARARLGLSEQVTVAYTGHFYAGRGIGLILDLAGIFPQAQFLLVGGRPDAVEAAQAEIDRRKLANVVLTGFVDNRRLALFQAAGDVLLMPYETAIAGSSGGNSVDICSPMKMFEYMAAGRAILSSDLPVIREVLNPSNATFARPEDLEDWQEKLALLLDRPEWRQRLGEQARSDAERYTWRERARRSLQGFS